MSHLVADLRRDNGPVHAAGKPAFVDPAAPLTVARGGRDRLLPLRHRANVLADYPHARMMTVPGGGHVP